MSIAAAIDHAARGIEHGGRLTAARLRYPGAPEPFLDLSTGINPLPYPVPPMPPATMVRLPEPEALDALQAAAAAAYGVHDPAMVVAAPGTQALIGLLPLLCPQPLVTVPGPTYAEHAAAWTFAGAAVRTVGLPPEDGGGALVLCNPNNPNGRVIAASTLSALAARHAFMVVDESFADFHPAESIVPRLPLPGVVVLRSFGKAYGLAGVRLGFALAAPALALRIRTALGPWAISGPALHAGTAALRDTAWRDATGQRLRADAARLDGLLAHAGLRVLGGTVLFRLAEARDAPARVDRLGQAGVLVRSFADAPTRIRFGMPGAAEDWGRLAAALGTVP